MPVPAQCQGFVDKIKELQGEIEDVGDLAGAEKWGVAHHNFLIRQQIAQVQRQLDSCIIAFGGGYSTEVTVLDLTPGGGAVTFPLEAMLWRVVGGSAVDLENRAVQVGNLSFVHGPSDPGGRLAISIDESPNATFTGPLFRSGSFATLPVGAPANASGAITIVIPGPVPVPAATVTGAVGGVTPPTVPGLTITAITATLGAGTVTLAITGLGLGFLPLTYTYVATIGPSRNMAAVASTICDVTPISGTISSTSFGGPAGLFFSAAMSLVEPPLRAAVTTALGTALNGAIAAAAASALGRPLTAFETISMRRVVVTASGITFFPAIGTFGP